ncbi:trans-sialidase [Trypanosoma grayi]|uniref:trans-sialidase n=1 Tax=Trypanosoma grayi TaxID=71804 RepID=UPI0004F3F617|nr:trans-sialidase [Trypanosoma grayi]KEG13448.1 trans-sialidase [Trypanosoma grayi]
MLRLELERAAHCLKEGNHVGADKIIRALQAIDDPSVAEYTINILKSDIQQLEENATYVHFIAFRLLRFYLTRQRDMWENSRKDLLNFFLEYTQSNSERLLTPAWRPVLSEAALDTAVVLKLGCCTGDVGGVNGTILSCVVSDVLSMMGECRNESELIFIRYVVLHTVEEFGLYFPASRGRGIPLKTHRACRSAFERDGLVRILSSLFFFAVCGAAETPRTVEVLFGCLTSVASWSLHSFFEEDASENECDRSFRVSGDLWRSLLLDGVPLPDAMASVDALLRKWYCDGSVCGIPFDRRPLVELIRQFCGVTMDSWDLSDKLQYGRRFLSLACFVSKDLLMNGDQHEDTRAIFSLPITGIVAIVENLEDIFNDKEIVDSCISELSLLARSLIELDNRSPDDEGVMAALDEALGGLFKIANIASQYGSLSGVVRSSALDVLSAFLASKLSNAHSSEYVDHFSDAFTASHITLLGHVGRLDPVNAADALCLALEVLRGRFVEMKAQSDPVRMQVQEGLWIVLRTIDAFVADACEGEDIVIPPCFLGSAWSESHPVLKIVLMLMGLMHEIMQQLSTTSPAVVSALLEVFGTFIGVYIFTEDQIAFLFAQGGTGVVSYVLHSLRVFTFDEDVALMGCRVLDGCAKNKPMISALRSCGLLQMTEEMISCGQQFYGNVRGRLAAFWVCCASQEAFSDHLMPILNTFDIHTTDSASVDVDLSLERCASLSGFFVSMQDRERLVVCFGVIMNMCDHVLGVSFHRFYEKEMTIRSTDMIMQLFLSYSTVVGGEQLLWLVEKVRMTLNSVTRALCEDRTWCTESAEEEKHRLLKVISRLLCEVSRWKMMDCDLSADAVQSLGSCVICVLAAILNLMNERCLSLPELQESVFLAFQQCAEAFTSEFVGNSSSQVFLSTIFFALNSDCVDTQRVGTAVVDTVVLFLRDSGLQSHELFSDFLSTIVRSFASGRLSVSLSPQLAQNLMTLCSCLPQHRIELVLVEALRENLDPNVSMILRDILVIVKECVMCGVARRQPMIRGLTEAVAESLSNIKGVLFV